jgi:hypothetical protein
MWDDAVPYKHIFFITHIPSVIKTGTNIFIVPKAQLTIMVAIGNINRKGCVE